MSTATSWFYAQGGTSRGPVSFEELERALHAMPDPHNVLVWHEGLAEWARAGSVPEIRGRLIDPSVYNLKLLPVEAAERLAKLYRRLVLLVGLQILLGLSPTLAAAFLPAEGGGIVAGILGLALLVLLVAVAVTAYQLTGVLGSELPILWAAAMFLPCINVITLLVLSAKSQSWCRQNGIKVGFLGPTKESIEEMRQRRVASSAFD